MIENLLMVSDAKVLSFCIIGNRKMNCKKKFSCIFKEYGNFIFFQVITILIFFKNGKFFCMKLPNAFFTIIKDMFFLLFKGSLAGNRTLMAYFTVKRPITG